MPFVNAVLWLDHHHAKLIGFDADQSHAQEFQQQAHATRQHGSEVRTEHEYFGEICDALTTIDAIVVTGSHVVQADFRHYLERHRSGLLKQITTWQTVDRLTEAQLLALARKLQHDRANGLASAG
ncbi:MAG: hypothetical protein V4573_14100 [Pseudomonadota bacterium]